MISRLLALAFLAFLLSVPRRSEAQSPPINTRLAIRYIDEARALCARDNGKLWGVSLDAPLLFVDPNTRVVIASEADKDGTLAKSGAVFVGKLPATVNAANTAVEWAGVRWTMLTLPLPTNKHRRAALLAHEMWHRAQDGLGFPDSGAANNHLDLRAGRVWLQLEWRALAVALASRGAARDRAIEDALLFRARRRDLFPQAATEERAMEMHEGLAEYTGVTLSGSPNRNRYVIDANLKEAAQKETFVRSFAYASGPAYGVLLDQANVNWRKNLRSGDDLGRLLQTARRIALPPNRRQAAERRAQRYHGDALQAAEAARETRRRKRLAEYRARFVDGPVLTLPLQKMRMQFNPGNLTPLGDLGTVYPNIRIVDEWGVLTVSHGALLNATFTKVYVPASPPRAGSSVSPLQGDGWTLELNAGWTLTTGARSGDYTLKKPQ